MSAAAGRLHLKRAQKAEYVLAVINGLIVGVFQPTRWMESTQENFPNATDLFEGRVGFEGHEAPEEILKLYLRKRLPEDYRKRGAANPVRYIDVA